MTKRPTKKEILESPNAKDFTAVVGDLYGKREPCILHIAHKREGGYGGYMFMRCGVSALNVSVFQRGIPVNGDFGPNSVYKLCSRCGTPDDFAGARRIQLAAMREIREQAERESEALAQEYQRERDAHNVMVVEALNDGGKPMISDDGFVYVLVAGQKYVVEFKKVEEV
jgi:hypothetical protein